MSYIYLYEYMNVLNYYVYGLKYTHSSAHCHTPAAAAAIINLVVGSESHYHNSDNYFCNFCMIELIYQGNITFPFNHNYISRSVANIIYRVSRYVKSPKIVFNTIRTVAAYFMNYFRYDGKNLHY